MKQTVILLMLLLSINLISKAQESFSFTPIDKYKVLDSAYLKCTYRLKYIKDTADVKAGISEDIQTLQIGSKISKYFSQHVFDFNLKTQELLQNGAQSYPNSNDESACGYEVFKYYPEGKFTVTDFGIGRIRENIHEESIPDLQWKMQLEYDTVLSYRCQKATTNFRGRNYEAWFTTEIPIGNGPWKLGGLPGLILKVSDVQHYFNFECIGLEKLKKKDPIKLYQINYSHIERLDLNKLYYRYKNNPVGFAKSLGHDDMIEYKGKTGTDVVYPYNPIELQ